MPTKQSWIISGFYDNLFIIGSAFWVGATFFIAQRLGYANNLAMFVLYVMALGHHLPGFLRIYIDPELFAFYRWRFIVIPVLVICFAYVLAALNLHTLTVVTFVWGLWHGIMQVYGFARIYDAKQGEFSPLTAWLDWILCVTWFVLLAFGSTFFADDFRLRTAEAGSSYVAELFLSPIVRFALVGITLAITAIHLCYTGWAWWRGRRVSVLKIYLLAASIGLFCISYRLFRNDKLISLAVWEAFHDIQYYAIVWCNNRRIHDARQLSGLGRVLFRPGRQALLLYLGLIAIYGAIDLGSRMLTDPAIGEILRPALVASAFLHFYFDGFIWKIRRSNVRRDLQIEPTGAKTSETRQTSERHRPGFPDLGWQLIVMFVPIMALVGLELDRTTWERPASEYLVKLFPNDANLHRNLGRLYERDRNWDSAVQEYSICTALDPQAWYPFHRLGVIFMEAGQIERAREAFLRASAAGADTEEIDFNLALLEWQHKDFRSAINRLCAAVDRYPNSARLLTTAATFLCTSPDASLRDPAKSLEYSRRALAIADPSHQPEILDTIAAAHALRGNMTEAISAIEKGIAMARAQHNSRREQALMRMLSDYQGRQESVH